MSRPSPLSALFIANATVLATHQIDAAFWREWEMFGIPGGDQVNLLLNIPILALVFLAHRETVLGSVRARVSHLMLASLGYLTVILHGAFFLAGDSRFVQPVSIGLIVVTGILSTLQFRFLLRTEIRE